jgi:hypothetical protein
MDHSSHSHRPHSFPSSHINKSTHESTPPRFVPERLLPETGCIAEIGNKTPQAVIDAIPLSRGPFCEKRVQSSDSVASDATTVVSLNQGRHHRQTRLKSILWRIFLIVLPIALLSALLLGLVLGLEVETEPSLFPLSSDSNVSGQGAYILVNLSATRLGVVPNSMSLLAPCLGSLIMGLWRLCTARSLQEATILAETQREKPRLPDIDEFRFVVGLIRASVGELFTYFVHLVKRRLAVPPVLHRAAAMLFVSLVLAAGVLVASTWLQIVMQAINFDAITTNPSPASAFGRGLSEMCLEFNRTMNEGFPCTYDLIAPETEFFPIAVAQNEIYYLQNNISSVSEIRLVTKSELSHGDLAVLIPQLETIPDDVDYRGSTIGVSTQCQPFTARCKMQAAGPGGQFTQFNCTDNFWGLLGKPSNVTTVTNSKAEDPDLPPMAFKPSQSLQYAFFTDAGLSIPYNTQGRNLSTGNFATNAPTLPDSDLINPIFVAIAGRLSTQDMSATSNLSTDPNMFSNGFSWIDFTLNCSYTTYDVNYTWASSAIYNVSFTPSLNGTLAEMYHGAQSFASVDGGNPALQDNLLRAAHQDTSDAFANEWANLYSGNILATIGAYTTPRTNLEEQTRTSMLVTQVPKMPLGLLLAFSLAYVILGIWLGIAAYRAARFSPDIWALATDLSLPAIVAAAFGFSTGEDEAKAAQADTNTTNHEKSSAAAGGANDPKIPRVRTADSSENGWAYTVSHDAV